MSSKILVLNPSPDKLNKILKKENSLQASSGPFDFVLLLGDVLSPGNVPDDLIHPTVETFFTEGTSLAGEEGRDVVDDLTFLGKYGVHTFDNGIKLGYVTGNLEKITPSELDATFNGQMLDILISYHWPSAIATELKLTLFGNSKIDTVVKLTKPRYHFTCGSDNGMFFERNSIYWKENSRITRFISLAQSGSKERYHYAFNMNLDSSADLLNYDGVESNPFLIKRQPEPVQEDKKVEHFIEEHEQEAEKVVKKRKKLPVTANECFFCLSNPKIETHMIISIGESCYITIAKGPLTRPHKGLIRFSGHGIIIPISHVADLQAVKGAESQVVLKETATFKEMLRYKQLILEMFSSIDPELLVVFFEISRAKSVHYHIQFVPILSKFLSKFDASMDKLLNNNAKYPRNYEFNFKPMDDEAFYEIQESTEYMLISVWTKDSRVNHVSTLDNAESFSVDLQFPRRVLANVLNDHRRVYWDKCKQGKEKETQECEDFKDEFKKFDLSS